MKLTDSVLVTGSKGFIGTHLMRALGDRGIGFDHNIKPFMDVNRPAQIHQIIRILKPRVIVHLAAVSSLQKVDRDPEQALKTNIIGTFNVLRIAEKHNIRVILASSAAVDEPNLSLYGVTKECAEDLAMMVPGSVIARLYNVYGPGSKSVVNKFIKLAKAGKVIKVNGNPTRDFIHVDDVVERLIQLIDADEPNKINLVGTGRSVTLNKLISIIKKESGLDMKIEYGEPIKEIQNSKCPYGDSRITLEKGVRGLI